ncbi:MAG: hypothetical protein AAFR35_10790 [Pseudomonadota bacterium]
MKTTVIASVLAVALAAPAFANDQLSRSLGVEPGALTVSELAVLKNAIDNDDNNVQFDAIRAGLTGDVVSTQSFGAAAQLAASVGVEPGALSVQELAVIKNATDNADDNRALASIRGALTGDVVSTQSGISAGHAQLAAQFDVDPTVYSVTDILELKSRIDNADDNDADA